jgi:putative restriction endonuclease
MATNARNMPRALPPMEAWPSDDTEESVLGVDLHQGTICYLRRGINEVAQLNMAPGHDVPWKATNQLPFLGCKRPDGSAYRTLPDVFVFPRHIDPLRGIFTVRVDGPPVLIIEVLGESTYEADLDLDRGKAYSYAQVGVREYMTIDPTGAYLPEGIRAWRLEDGAYRPWEAGADGRFQSTSIPVAIGLEGMISTVYTHDGRRMLHEGEVEAELSRHDAALAQRDAALAQRDAALAQRDAEVARLQRLLDEKSKE